MFSTKKQQQFLAWNKLVGGGGGGKIPEKMFRKAVFYVFNKKKQQQFLAWNKLWGVGQDTLAGVSWPPPRYIQI